MSREYMTFVKSIVIKTGITWNNMESYGMLDISLTQSFKINTLCFCDTAPTRGHDKSHRYLTLMTVYVRHNLVLRV